jgi:HlyD family secretion protein
MIALFSRWRPCLALGTMAVLIVGCGRGRQPDAYGNFEAVDVTVSAQTAGQIEQFTPVEGVRLERGAVVALIDTTQLALERQQAAARRAAAGARRRQASEQLAALQAQWDIAKRAYERTERLYAQHAATSAQLDQTERDYRSLSAQIEAARALSRSVALDSASAEARVRQIAEQLGKSSVTNPQAGTVLAVYARAGEVVQPGQPLYKIADLDTLTLRAYITGDQLTAVRLGQRVPVSISGADGGVTTLAGEVSWISPTAEFTPTPVQTRDERADLVYAIKIRVPNQNGILKIGMPGDVAFAAEQ